MNNLIKSWIHPTAEIVSSTSTLTKAGAAAASFVCASVLHSLTPVVIGTIFILVMVDTATGLAVAISRRKVSSKKWYRCLVKLVNYSGLIIVGGLTSDVALLSWMSGTFLLLIIMTELISILENLSIVQPDLVPSKILKVLHLLKD